MEEKKQGGKRIGAGRKPLPITEKKTSLTIYPPNKDLYKFGDKKKMAEEILKFIAGYGKEQGLVVKSGFQDLTKPTHEIKAFEQPKSNYEINTTKLILSEPKPPKSFEQYKREKRECENEEQWEALKAEIEADPYLSGKQKDLLIKYS